MRHILASVLINISEVKILVRLRIASIALKFPRSVFAIASRQSVHFNAVFIGAQFDTCISHYTLPVERPLLPAFAITHLRRVVNQKAIVAAFDDVIRCPRPHRVIACVYQDVISYTMSQYKRI